MNGLYRDREGRRQMDVSCRHEESLYGRCVFCGKTWEEQAQDRTNHV